MLWSRTSYAFVRLRNIPTTCRHWFMAFKLLTQILENSINVIFLKFIICIVVTIVITHPRCQKNELYHCTYLHVMFLFRTGYLNIRNWRKLGGRLVLRILAFKIYSPPCWKSYKVGSEQANRRQWPWGLCVSENVWGQNKEGEGKVRVIFCSKKRWKEI